MVMVATSLLAALTAAVAVNIKSATAIILMIFMLLKG
jgi:hypothetical protein